MRKVKIAEGEYYHICNRGVGKKLLFRDKSDWVRFLFLILYFQSPVVFENIGRFTKKYARNASFEIDKITVNKILKDRYVTLNSFCLMPNHFHILVHETVEGGIAKYMHRVLNSYAKYYNTKYDISGHLFEGPYRCIHMEDNVQLLHVSAYIHKNAKELKEWRAGYWKYPWGSLNDTLAENRWPEILNTEIIVGQFEKSSEYKEFVKTSSAKEFEDIIEIEL